MKNKGFTLIELLAVILILGIIALIAVPLVSNVINESKEKAAIVSALNYVKAIEDKIAKDKLLGRNSFVSGKTYQVEQNTKLIDIEHGNISQLDGETVLDIDNSFYLKDVIDIKGNAPTDGYIIYEDGKVEEVALIINGLLVTGTAEQIRNGTLDVDKFSGTSNIASVEINNPKLEILGGDTHQLSVTVNTNDGEAPNRKTKYSSSNTSVAKVNNKGQITAINEGTTTITAKAGIKRTSYVLTVYNGSLLGYVGTLNESGIYQITINNVTYDLNVIVLEGNQTISSNTNYGTLDDCASGIEENQMAKRMVIVKVNGNYTVNSGVTVGPIYDENYGGPKGFMLYVTGTLTNNGTIDNSHGAYAEGQNVYLYKNSNNTYEYVAAVGANGGVWKENSSRGQDGSTASKRATGGGGAKVNNPSDYGVTTGGTGTSYSGGSGGSNTNDTYINKGGVGATGSYRLQDFEHPGGVGNPGGKSTKANTNLKNNNGTGGLLIIYANSYVNNGIISANGTNTSHANGGASGAGSINIFTNESTNINRLGVVTNDKYDTMLGTVQVQGGAGSGGHGGDGTVNIGETRNGQYYDLKQIIEQDKQTYINSRIIQGDSILSILQNNNFTSGYYVFKVKDEQYQVHLYAYDGNQNWDGNVIGESSDCATGESLDNMAQNMVIAKVNGDLTNTGTIRPYYDETYGGPKGFTLYVTGTLTNNGTIDNSHGAYAEGQNVYLWKNSDNTYEYVPAVGAQGAVWNVNDGRGQDGSTAGKRATGGGGTKINTDTNYGVTNGGTGTSYSGGSGGSNTNDTYINKGGVGATGSYRLQDFEYPGGVGNPGGKSTKANTNLKNNNGTGGLLIIYANSYANNGTISANGTATMHCNGGSSGGGSINIFYRSLISMGSNITANAGTGVYGYGSYCGSSVGDKAQGGKGTINHTQIN